MRIVRACLALILLSCFANGPIQAASPVDGGPLQVHAANPRYFTDESGRAIWLTGSHTWANLHERGVESETPDFDFDGYLAFLKKHGHNFIRLWAWEHAQWMQFAAREVPLRYRPLPYSRTGPGNALDGKPKFDLNRFDESFFERLRERVTQANERGIYVSVMLFQGFSLDKRRGNAKTGNAWHGHPLHRQNNINGINGNPSGDDSGHEVHTLQIPKITRIQEAYVRKTIDTLTDLDNVLWEIGNENHRDSVDWQSHLVRFIHDYEATRDKRHLVGMTGAPIATAELLASPADWISPPQKEWLTNPPPNDGEKIVIVDTDHCDPWHHDPSWVWKNFFRGNHFILMDGYMDYRLGTPDKPDVSWNVTRDAMGQARWLSERVELARLVPAPKRSSTGYCLARDKTELLVYQPQPGQPLTVEVAGGRYQARWYSTRRPEEPVVSTMSVTQPQVALTPPFDGPAVLHLQKENDGP